MEITRLVDPSSWYYVNNENMVADLGTRKGAKIEDVGPNISWINGLPWMRGKEAEFPVRTIEEIRLSGQERGEANIERVGSESENTDSYVVANHVSKEVGVRYKFSQYLINPNKYRFRTVIRIMGLVFIKKLNEKCNKSRIFKFLESRYFNDVQSMLFNRKGCKDMIISYSDIQHRLHVEYGVEFKTRESRT